MKLLKVKKSGDVHLYPIADLHLGSEICDLRKINETIKKIREDDKAVVVLLGDILEVAITGSKGNPYTSMSVEEELNLAVEVLKPIRDKIYLCVTGNHERRISKNVGFDIFQIMVERLRIADKYCNQFGVLKIAMKRTAWYIGCHHGVGGGRLKGGKINNLHRFGSIFPNVDIFLTGHTHDFIITADNKFVIDRKHDYIYQHTTFYINVPSMLKYGGYGADYAYQPTISGCIRIKLPDVKNRNKRNSMLSVETV